MEPRPHPSTVPAPTASLAELAEARQRELFINHEDELSLLGDLLRADGGRILYIHGPAGVGKTSLLQAFAADARAAAIPVATIDARDLEPSLAAVTRVLDAVLPPSDTRRLVLIDTYELLRGIEPLIFREFLRRVGGATLCVIASRRAPSAEWRALPVWGHEIRGVALRNLPRDAAELYLQRRGVAGPSLPAIVDFAHGFPLALAIAADAARHADSDFAPSDSPDVIGTLYDYFMRGVGEPARRAALESAAVLHTTSEALLAAMLGHPVGELYSWLRELNMMVPGGRGIFPHDLAREVILAELRGRDSARLAALVNRAQRLYADLLKTCAPAEQGRVFAELAFAIGHDPLARVLLVPPDTDLYLDVLRPGDEPLIEAAVARFEGEAEVPRVRHWLRRQPETFQVARDSRKAMVAFVADIRLDRAAAEDLAADPIAAAALDHARRLLAGAPLGAIGYGRYFMDLDTYQAASPGLGLVMQCVSALFFLPDVNFHFVRVGDWESIAPIATFSRSFPQPELTHETDGRRYVVAMQDLRELRGVDFFMSLSASTPLAAWQAPPSAPVSLPELALSKTDFFHHVREALRALNDPIALARSPLCAARVVAPGSTSRERVEGLRALLVDEIAALDGGARTATWHRVLTATFLAPYRKHEVVARDLAMSYSTFRRHLTSAIEHLAERLWERELVS